MLENLQDTKQLTAKMLQNIFPQIYCSNNMNEQEKYFWKVL